MVPQGVLMATDMSVPKDADISTNLMPTESVETDDKLDHDVTLGQSDVETIVNKVVKECEQYIKSLESKFEMKINIMNETIDTMNEKHQSEIETMKNQIVMDYEDKLTLLKTEMDCSSMEKLTQMENKLSNEYEEKLYNLKTLMISDNNVKFVEMDSRVTAKTDTFLQVIGQKDTSINKLNESLGEVQKSIQVTDEQVNMLKEDIRTLNYHSGEQLKELNYLLEKSSDLEDRSKRHNLIFKGFSEESGWESNEECEKKLRNLIVDRNMLDGQALVSFDRVHRLGKKKKDARYPRPIICKVTSYKDKETIKKNAAKLRGSRISMSEDYSAETQEIHKNLFNACKAAKDREDSTVEKFYVNYKYASVHFNNGIKRNFNMSQIEKKRDWYNIVERADF